MASEALFQALAEALSKPPKNYQALQTAFQIPEAGIKGYKEGADLADEIRKRKLNQSTLSEVLGGNVRGLEEFGNTPFSSVKEIGQGVSGLSDLVKARQAAEGGGDYLTPMQAKEFGLPDSFINSFGGKPINRNVAQGYVANQTRNKIAGTLDQRQQLAVANTINKNVNALTGTGALGLAGKNNLRIARVKSLLERPTQLTPQELDLVTTDLAGVVQGGAPLRDSVEGQQIGTVATKMADLLKQASNQPQTFNDAGFRTRIIQLANEMVAADNDVQEKAFNTVKANFGHLATPEHLERVHNAIRNGEQLPIIDLNAGGLDHIPDEALRAIAGSDQ